MSLMRYRGLLVVVLWQTPSPIAVDSTGRIQGAFGFGGGEYEDVLTSCEGDLIDASRSKFSGGGAQVDAWPTRSVRLTGFGGALSADSAEWDGAYLGALAALEYQHIGVGLGAVAAPNGALPAAYLRLGNRDAFHARFEIAPPTAPLGTTGTVRAGLGYHLGHLRGFGAQGGVALCHARCVGESRSAVYGDFRIPLGSWFDAEARVLLGQGLEHTNSGLAVGGRVHFGR